MKKIFTILFTLVLLITTNHAYQKEVISIIPKPAKMEIFGGNFKFLNQTKIWISEQSDELQKLGDLIASSVNQSTGLK